MAVQLRRSRFAGGARLIEQNQSVSLPKNSRDGARFRHNGPRTNRTYIAAMTFSVEIALRFALYVHTGRRQPLV
jgi:hypothetical protein